MAVLDPVSYDTTFRLTARHPRRPPFSLRKEFTEVVCALRRGPTTRARSRVPLVSLVSIVSTPYGLRQFRKRYGRRAGQSSPFPAVHRVFQNVEPRASLVESGRAIAGKSGPGANIVDARGLGTELAGKPLLASVELDRGFSAFAGYGSIQGGFCRRSVIVCVAGLTDRHPAGFGPNGFEPGAKVIG